MITIRGLDDPTTAQAEPIQRPTCEQEPIDEVDRQAGIARGLGGYVEITGQWAWCSFGKRPSNEVLAVLKSNKWIWCNNKKKWAYRGVPSHSKRNMSWDYIVDKYGVKTVSNIALEES